MMMRVRAAIAVVLAGVLLGVSGCALRPSGADGDLLDDWQPLAAPKFDVPSIGTCLDSPMKPAFDPTFVRAAPIECDRGHTLEVALIGTVDGNAAQGSEPPASGSEGFRAAYAACDKAANEYLGGDWHTGMLGINVQMPNQATWRGGLRSYVCSIFTLTDAYGNMAFGSASVKGTLTGSAPNAIKCLEVNGTKDAEGWWDDVNGLTPIDCTKPHEAEFIGTAQVGTAGGPLPAAETIRKSMLDRCWTLGAAYLGMTEAQMDARTELGVAWDGMEKFQWEAGDRNLRCFVLLSPGKKVRASIKGLGKKALPY
ncbi:septum formation family protein [Dactylosporangium sp. NBC_01737]|uniref:septum formation family protein n=1 Tax=Dactylosporangium sp. NBC_01737 TaxID=2975959 RepID=UPI002E0DD757|nr:septum formation family protein [Dactylosporangium sp. NBC_01737]